MSGRHDAPKNYGFGGVFKSLTKSLKPASGRVPVVINAKVVGGGADMQGLLARLQNGTLATRVASAEEITGALAQHSVSSIPEIWYLARDLCDRRHAPAVRRTALRLMAQCIAHDDIATVSNQLMYYRDVVRFCGFGAAQLDPEFDLFFAAVRTLTADGKDIHDLCIYNQERSWPEFMLLSLATARDAVLAAADTDAPGRVVGTLCAYLHNCCKFNFSLLDEPFVAAVLDHLAHAAPALAAPDVLSRVCELINVIAVFGYVPPQCYPATFQLLCWLASFSPELHSTCSDSATRLFVAAPHAALDAVLAPLHSAALREYAGASVGHAELRSKASHRALLTALGALAVLESMLSRCGSDHMPDHVSIAYDALYWGIDECLALNVTLLNSGLLRIFDHLFSPSDDPQSAARFASLFPFYAWFSSTCSVVDLLAKAKLNSSQDRSYWAAICSSIYEQHRANGPLAPEEKLVHLFMLHPDCVDHDIVAFIIDTYVAENMCTSLHPFYIDNCNALLRAFYFQKMPPAIRINVLKAIKAGYDRSLAFSDDDSVIKETVLQVLKSAQTEDDESVTDYILHTFLVDFLKASSLPVFHSVIGVFTPHFASSAKPRLVRTKTLASAGSLGSNGSHSQFNRRASVASTLDEKNESSLSKFLNELSKSMCSSFVSLAYEQPEKANDLFNFLIDLLRYSLRTEPAASLAILRTFVRIRCTNDGSVFFSNPTDMDGLATAFKRNSEDESFECNAQSLWMYPESVPFLSANYFDVPCPRLVIAPEAKFNDKKPVYSVHRLDIAKWVDIVLLVIEEHIHWELYSYVWAHMCSQLFNMRVFWHLREHVIRISELACDQLTLNFPKSLTFPIPHSSLTKSDLQVAYIRNLSALIGYHDLFSKQEEDHIVSSLLFGLSAWQKTAIPCIHMLTITCYEIPESLKRYLSPILSKLQTGTTNVFAGALILEFLMALTQVPSLTADFTNEEFKQVFATSFRFIEHALHSRKLNNRRGDTESRTSEARNSVQSHGIDAQVDRKPSTQKTTVTPILTSYLLMVSFSVIGRWFLSIDIADRSNISSFIIASMISCTGAKSVGDLDTMTIAFMDMVSRFTYSNIPLKIVTNLTSRSFTNFTGVSNKWIVGHGIVEIITNPKNGDSTIILRRPSGVSAFHISLDASMVPPNTDLADNKALISNSYMLLQLFKPSVQDSMSKPLPLSDDAVTERAINTFDRIPVVAHHKAGIVYIAPGQKDESEILANTVGSRDYQQFLEGLGRMIKLSTAESLYVGGLDKAGGTDGEYAYFWSDEVTHLIFHTTTMMPNIATDKMYLLKKRHIGNNHVNVFFDESGFPFNFNVIKSQFNFLNVVVSPHTLRKRLDEKSDRPFYKVKVFRRSGLPGIFSTTHYKLISLEQLPHLVRNIVIMANKFSDIWHNMNADETFTSSWQLRVDQLNKLREKTVESQRQVREEPASTDLKTMEAVSKTTAEAFLEQLQVTDLSLYDRPAASTDDFNVKENDLYSHLEFNSYA